MLSNYKRAKKDHKVWHAVPLPLPVGGARDPKDFCYDSVHTVESVAAHLPGHTFEMEHLHI